MAEASQFGRYVLARRIGSGGMAEVFLAYERRASGAHRPVVLKRILPHRADSEAYLQMFLDEARIAARFHHPNLVEVFELTQIAGQACLVMEYLEGVDLDHLLVAARQQQRPLDCALVAHLIAEAADGLQAAHDLTDDAGQPLQLVHRDVSPSNLVVTWDGAVKVVDFGIAKHRESSTHTQTGVLKGKLSYMSPEQGLGQAVDRRSDIFSLGIVLYELLTLQRCFKHRLPFETLEAVILARYVPPAQHRPDLPEALARVLDRMLARAPEDRYAQAADAAAELRRFVAQQGHTGGSALRQLLAGLDLRPSEDPARVFTVTSHSALQAAAAEPEPDEPAVRPEPTAVVRLGLLGRPADQAPEEETVRIPLPPAPRAPSAEPAAPAIDEATRRERRPELEPAAAPRTSRGEETVRERTPSSAPPAPVPSPPAPELSVVARRAAPRRGVGAWLGLGLLAAAMLVAVAIALRSSAGLSTEPGSLARPMLPGPLAGAGDAGQAAAPAVPPVPAQAVDAGPRPDVDTPPDPAPPAPRTVSERAPLRRSAPRPVEPCRVRLTSEPPVTVFVDGKGVGRTPVLDLELAPGAHGFALRNPALGLSRSFRWTLRPGERGERHETFGTGRVAIRVEPWAEVYLRGEKLGTTPMPPFELYEGAHELLLRHPPTGVERRVTVQVVPGRVSKIDETL